MYLNSRETHLWFVSPSQSRQVLHLLHELVWVIGLIHWSELCRVQGIEMLDGKQWLNVNHHIELLKKLLVSLA